jgi:hypothetical protein
MRESYCGEGGTHKRGHEIITLSCVVMKYEKCIKMNVTGHIGSAFLL